MFREDAGNPRQLSMNGVGGFDSIHGGALPTEVWTEYMLQAMKGVTPESFPPTTPIGQRFDQEGMPTPTPTPTPSEKPSEKPSQSPSQSAPPTNSPSPTPTDSCSPWDLNCRNSGGAGERRGQWKWRRCRWWSRRRPRRHESVAWDAGSDRRWRLARRPDWLTVSRETC